MSLSFLGTAFRSISEASRMIDNATIVPYGACRPIPLTHKKHSQNAFLQEE
jgi:hypothetical protein